VEIDPAYSRAWYNLGLLQSRRGEEDAAIESLRMAIETNPTDPAGPYALATIHARRGEAETARDLLRQTLRLAPEHTPARRLLNRLMIAPNPGQ
jgi:Flp pilus assembly protein TadD